MEGFLRCFSRSRPAVIAMIHVPALPGTPKNCLPFQGIVAKARSEAALYKQCGVDAVMVENMHDIPYVMADKIGPEITATMTAVCHEVKATFEVKATCEGQVRDAVMVENMHDIPYMMADKIGPEITATMTAVCHEVKATFEGPVGVQILAGANKQALAVALAADLQFIRAECFVFSHVADEGLMHACAGDLMRYRKQIGAENVMVFTDVKKKHSSHAITSDVSIEDTAAAAEMFLADGVIVTGTCTGKQADPSELESVKSHTALPVLIGSGITTENLHQYITADGVIVGSHFKQGGLWSNDIDKDVVSEFMKKANSLR